MTPCIATRERYNSPITSVKRDRDWRPVESPRRKPWSLFAESAAFLSVPSVYGGSDGGPCAHRFSQEVPGTPTCPSCRLPLAWGVVVVANRTHLEAFMATSTRAAAPILPITGTPDPIQLQMQAMNSLSICRALITATEPCYLFALNHLAAAQKAIEALSTIDPNRLEG